MPLPEQKSAIIHAETRHLDLGAEICSRCEQILKIWTELMEYSRHELGPDDGGSSWRNLL